MQRTGWLTHGTNFVPWRGIRSCFFLILFYTKLTQLVFYRPQTKSAKVMFSQVSVCPWGVSAPLHAGIHTPLRTKGRQPPPRRADNPLDRHPPAQDMLGYGQREGGMHPTGMHSCFFIVIWQLTVFYSMLRYMWTTICSYCFRFRFIGIFILLIWK